MDKHIVPSPPKKATIPNHY